MTIALFGGAFDPPHIGHKQVADYLVNNNVVDEVWFVPVYKHPWADRYGKQSMAPYEDRVSMLQLMCDAQQKVAHYKDVSFTYDTLTYFADNYPAHQFTWVMGSEYLDRWDDFLLTHPKLSGFEILIYPRAGYDLAPLADNMTPLPEAPEVKAASSDIRSRLMSSKPTTSLLLPEVQDFIEDHDLYRA